MAAKIHSFSDYLPEDEHILIPEGEYLLAYQSHKTWLYMGRIPKVVLFFRIETIGEHHGKPIMAYYNVKKIMGRKGKNGRFSVGLRSDFMMDFATCFGTPVRKDRIPMTRFEDYFVVGQVRTVTRNREQREYPEGLTYSVVDRLIGKFTP